MWACRGAPGQQGWDTVRVAPTLPVARSSRSPSPWGSRGEPTAPPSPTFLTELPEQVSGRL